MGASHNGFGQRQDPVPALFEHCNAESTGRLLRWGQLTGLAEMALRPLIGGLVRAAVATPNDTGDSNVLVEALVQTIDKEPTPGRPGRYLLRWKWMYSPGSRASVEGVLKDFMGWGAEELQDERFRDGEFGSVYCLDDTAPSEVVAAINRLREVRTVRTPNNGSAESQDARLRRHERLQVDLPCRFVAGDNGEPPAQGTTYNISRGGLYVLTSQPVPSEGERVSVQLRIPVGPEGTTDVTLDGNVRWRLPCLSASVGGGFGLDVDAVEDGANGARLQEFLAELLTLRYGPPPPTAAPSAPVQGAQDESPSASRDSE